MIIGAAPADAVAAAVNRLRRGLATGDDKPEETAEATLAALWHLAAGVPLSATEAGRTPLSALDTAATARLDTLLQHRLDGVPLAHLTGRQQFLGLELLVGPDALIPRRETELLAQAAIDLLLARPLHAPPPLVVDVCTGSGNVAVAIAARVPAARVLCADLSEGAVELARQNVAQLGVTGQVQVRCGDLLAPFSDPELQGAVDLLTCNPPYISTRTLDKLPAEIAHHEPRLAFDGGALGLSIVQRLIREAPRLLMPGGALMLEIGRGQGPMLLERLRRSRQFFGATGLCDAGGAVRVITTRRGAHGR
jgi:release factor glutamine methyltransferase